MTRSINHTRHEAWKAWIRESQDLRTYVRRNPLRVLNVRADSIEVLAMNKRSVRLDYGHLDALWEQRDRVDSEITKPRGKGKVALNTIANQIWKESHLAVDNTNESYYWAVVCERVRGEGGLLGLDSDYEAAEGNSRLQQHLKRERRQALVAQKKLDVFQATGKLACEACGFDYAKRYPGLGTQFCEVHHRVPLARGARTTKLAELAILCSNCHRMIHRTDPMESVETFRKRLSP